MRPLLVLAFAGCTENEPRGTYVYVESAATALTAEAPILFLNRCEGGCTLAPGPDDSRINQSSIIDEVVTLPEFPHPDAFWKRTLRCVQELYEPFEIVVTDRDPGSTPHIESIVAGSPSDIGQGPGVGGVSPFACGLIPNGINYSFAQVYDHPISLCNTVAQESGHTFGLDHLMLCNDPMTYLPACGEKEFQRIDAFCGEFEERDCFCGGKYQNSHVWLLHILGERVTPVDYVPIVEIVVPLDGAEVEPLFRVFADIDDDRGIAGAELSIDGAVVATSSAAPFGFAAPRDLPIGEHRIGLRAWDFADQEDSDEIMVTLIPREPAPDAGFFDAGQNPGPPPRTFADAGVDPEIDPTLPAGGCACVPAGGGSLGGLLGILALARPRRRR